MHVRVRLLGGFAVDVDGEAVPADAWRSRRSRQLAALLALAPGRRVTLEQAMDTLWPELDPQAARANLHKAASLARRATGSKDFVVLRGGAVVLCPGAAVEVDAERFSASAEAALRSGEAAACTEAAAGYGGELLPDERYEEWALAERDRLRRLHVDLLSTAGRWAEVVDTEPTDEGAHRALMREHLAAGRVHAAIRQYQRVRTALRRELGLAPSAETTGLYREILETAATGADRPGLVGREVELVRAGAALRRAREGRPAAVLVEGPAGIGKTRLCEELADQAAADGWLVLRAAARESTRSLPYAPLTEAVGGLLLQRPDLARALGDAGRSLLARLDGTAAAAPSVPVHRQAVLHLVTRLLAAADATNGVLVVDDLHHADDATVELLHLLAGAPFPRGLLVVAGLRPGPPPPVRDLRDALVRGGVAVGIHLGPLRRPEIDDIVAGVRDGVPSREELDLVWELSGGNAFLALEVATSTDALAAAPAGGVGAAVAARMRRLPTDTEQALRRVALVAEELTADEFAALAGVGPDRALDALVAATDAGVVARHGSSYRFRHDLVREELCRDVAPAEVTEAHLAAAERLAGLGAPAARVAHHLLAAGRGTDALPWLRRAVVDAFAVGAQADAVTLADRGLALAPRDPELLAWRADALATVGDPGAPAAYAVAMAVAEPPARRSLAIRRAKTLVVAGDIPAALETLAGVDEVDPADRVQLLVARGLAWWCAGRLDDADEAGQEARLLAVETGELRDFVDATMLTAMVAHERGTWPQRASLDLLDSTLRPDLATVVIDAHLCVAESYLYGGAPYEDVIAFATDLARRAGEAGAARTEAFAATLLGEAHLLRGDVPLATGHLRAAVARHRTVGVLCGEALTLQRLAEALLAAGDGDGARAALDEAFVAARGSPVGTRHLLDRIHGTAIRAARDASAAVDAVEGADRDLRGPLETCPPCSINLSVPAAIACAAAGDVERAAGYLARSEHVVAAFYPRGGWRAALDEARAAVARSSGDAAGAARLLQQAAEGFERWGQRLDAGRCRLASSELSAGKV